jgi:predicted transposase/invertase (TIGR01784 family)
MLVDIVENAKRERIELFEKGREKGVEEGIEKGIEKSKFDVAQNLLKMGDSVEKVAKATKLPIEEIQKLKNDLKI